MARESRICICFTECMHAEAVSTSSPRHDAAEVPAIVNVDLGKQLAFPDGTGSFRSALIQAYSRLTAGADPTADQADPATLPGSTGAGWTAGEDERAPQQQHAQGGSPATAARGAARETHGRQSGDAGRARPARLGKLEGVRRCGLCGCGAAATTDAAEEAVEAVEAPRWTVEEEVARARQRFEAISAAAAAVPTVVVQPDSELCLCELDRLPSGRPSSSEAVTDDVSGTASEHDGYRSSWGAHLAAREAGGSGDEESQGLAAESGARVEGHESSAGLAEPARVPAEEPPHAEADHQSAARERGEAVAAGEPCFCYRIDLGARDFEHVLQ